MGSITLNTNRTGQRGLTLVLLGLLGLGFASCRSSHDPCCRSEAPPPRRAETNIDPGWPKADNGFHQVSYSEVRGSVPKLAGAEMVNDDEICMQCHEAYVKSFHENVHRVRHCEDCHGPASRHSRPGQGTGADLQLQEGRRSGRPRGGLLEVPRAEPVLARHAVADLEARPLRRDVRRLPPRPLQRAGGNARHHHRLVRAGRAPSLAAGIVSARRASAGYARLLQRCRSGEAEPAFAPRHVAQPRRRGAGPLLTCHGDMHDLLQIAGPHQICGPNGFNCTTCHDPHGQIIESTRKDLCLSCHKRARRRWPGTPRSTSTTASPARTATIRTRIRRSSRSLTSTITRSSGPSGWRCPCRSRRPATSATRRYSPRTTCLRTTRSWKARWSAPIATIRTASWRRTSRQKQSTCSATSATRRRRARSPIRTRR